MVYEFLLMLVCSCYVVRKVVVAQDMNSMLKDIGVGGRTHAQKKEDFSTKYEICRTIT